MEYHFPSRIPRKYWTDLEHQRKKLEQVGKKLGVKELDDWYKVSRAEACKRASFIVPYYNGNLLTALQTLFGQHPWNPSHFPSLHRGYWSDLEHQRRKLEHVGREFGVEEPDDWYTVPRDKVCK